MARAKYMYNGIKLRIYCEQNNINYMNILKYISNYRKKNNNPKLTDDEIVLKAVEIYTETFYKGISLKIYCEYKDRLNYINIKNYIIKRKLENPNITDDELIEEYIDKKYKRHGKYIYNGILLADYCKLNNLNANNIRRSMRRFKEKHKDLNLTDEEIFKIIIEKYIDINPKEINNIEDINKEPIADEINNKIEVNINKDNKKITKKELLKKLRDLPKDDLEFIILKYQHKYTDLELAKNFNITLVDVINKENELIETLREKYKIKVLTKKESINRKK